MPKPVLLQLQLWEGARLAEFHLTGRVYTRALNNIFGGRPLARDIASGTSENPNIKRAEHP